MSNELRPPPSLASRLSEFEKAKRDGVAFVRLVSGVQDDALDRACEKIWFDRVQRSLVHFAPDEDALKRHWPWIAFACVQYSFERREMSAYDADALSPRDVERLLERISKNARQLTDDLGALRSHSSRVSRVGERNRTGHLSWLSAFLAQAIAGQLKRDLDDTGKALWVCHCAQKQFIERLVNLEVAARHLKEERLDARLLRRSRGQDDPGLTRFVRRIAQVWESLTGRTASANKINGGEDPDFVRFVQECARLIGSTDISRSMVETALP